MASSRTIERARERAEANKPKRQSVVRKDSSVVQGKTSYVLWRKLTWGEQKGVMEDRKQLEADPLALAKRMQEIIVDHIEGWNWVDDEGEALALPSEQPDGFDELNEDEISYLATLLNTEIDPKA